MENVTDLFENDKYEKWLSLGLVYTFGRLHY